MSVSRKKNRGRIMDSALDAPTGECRTCWARGDAEIDAKSIVTPDTLSERTQRLVLRLLVQAEEAADRRDWDMVGESARMVLAVDPYNGDAQALVFLVAHARTSAFDGPFDFPVQGW
ncbi:MAG: hypothetical protein IIB27_03990 [Chloroflexi bacterium]|nr:hypothetical protein [Chloroflexota bacterium]